MPGVSWFIVRGCHLAAFTCLQLRGCVYVYICPINVLFSRIACVKENYLGGEEMKHQF